MARIFITGSADGLGRAGDLPDRLGCRPRDRPGTAVLQLRRPRRGRRAGRAERLPSLLRRWSVFLHDGFDTFGECWGWGTPVHAWSATPTKDLIWYVLGVTPAEPGYAAVRIAPRPGPVERISGAVPTPHGLVRVEVDSGQVRVDSPVPVRFVSLSGDESLASAGHSEFTL